MSLRPIGEDDLHGFVDGRLDAERHAAVESWLAAHPAEAVRLHAWQAQSAALRGALDPVAREAVPSALRLDRLRDGRRDVAIWLHTAAAVLLFALGGLAGWGLSGARDPAGPPMADAMAAHRVYAARAMGAVEITDNVPTQLGASLSQAVGWVVPVPDLSKLGLSPLGGRVLPSDDGLAAFVIYEGADGVRLSLFVRRSQRAGPGRPEITARDPQLRAAVWFRHGFGHAVVGNEAPDAVLIAAATMAGG